MFSRQSPKTRQHKIRDALWPAMGWRRLAVYYRHRMGRLPGTPYFIASGFATGVAISFTPFIGFHLLMGFVICWLMRSSFLAMAMGTLVAGNIWTLPLAMIASYETGVYLLGSTGEKVRPVDMHIMTFIHHPQEFFLPIMIGSLPILLVSWLLTFYLVSDVIKNYRSARHGRIYKDKKEN